MDTDDLSAIAAAVENGLRRDFPHLRCAVRPYEDTSTAVRVPTLILEVRALDGTSRLQAVRVLFEEDAQPAAVPYLVQHIGESLERLSAAGRD